MVKVICDYQLCPYTERGVGVKVYGEECNMLVSKVVDGVALEVSIYSDSVSRITLEQKERAFSLKIDHKTKFEWVNDVLKFSYKENLKPILGEMSFLADKIVITMNNLVMNIFYFEKADYFGSNIVKDTLKMLTDHFVNNQKHEPEKTAREMLSELQDEMMNQKKCMEKKYGDLLHWGLGKKIKPGECFPGTVTIPKE